MLILLFGAGSNLVKLVGTQHACENGKLNMRIEPSPLLHHLRIPALIRKRKRVMHAQLLRQPLHLLKRPRLKLMVSLLRRISLSSGNSDTQLRWQTVAPGCWRTKGLRTANKSGSLVGHCVSSETHTRRRRIIRSATRYCLRTRRFKSAWLSKGRERRDSSTRGRP